MSTEPACSNPDVGQHLAAYELGLLAAAERREVEEHLLACEACREGAYETAGIATAMSGDPTAILGRLEREVAPADGSAAAPGRLAPFLRRLAARLAAPRFLVPAAAMAALALFVLLRPAGGPASLARVEPLPWVPLAVRDGGAEDADTRFERAMARYAEGEITAAEPLLAAALETLPPLGGARRDQALLYLGVVRLLSENPEGAVAPLRSASESPLPVISDRARWYLAQAHLTLGDVGSARPLLQELAERSPGYGEAAGGQLRRLEALAR